MSLEIENKFGVIDWNDLSSNRIKFANDVFNAF